MRVALSIFFFSLPLTACDLSDTSSSSDGGTSCGSSTCSSSQVCTYRECTTAERCMVATQCPSGSTPTTCGGQPGCLLATCGPVVVGCRALPSSCTAGDGMCACQAICADAGGCSKVDGINVDCVGTP